VVCCHLLQFAIVEYKSWLIATIGGGTRTTTSKYLYIGLQYSFRFVLVHNKYGFSPARIASPSLVQVFPQADADRSRHKQVPEVVHTPSIATYLPKCSLFGKAILQECTVEQQGKDGFACCGGRMVPSCPPARRCFQETDRQVSSSSLWSLCTNSMTGSMMALPSVWLLVEWLYHHCHQISRFCFFAEGRASSTLFGSSRRSVLMGPEGGLRRTLVRTTSLVARTRTCARRIERM